jgi:transposase
MSDQFWLTKAQLKRIEPFFPRTRGIPRVDDRRVVSGIVHVSRNGLGWRDAPAVYGSHKTLYNRFVRWSRTEGPMSDHKGADLIYPMLPDAETLIADKGYDSDVFREALVGRGITPCISPRAKRRLPATYCTPFDRAHDSV